MQRYESTSSSLPSTRPAARPARSNSIPKLPSATSHSGYLMNAWLSEDALVSANNSASPTSHHTSLPPLPATASQTPTNRSFWSVVMNTDAAPATPSATTPSTRERRRRASAEERPFACDRCTSRFVLKGHLVQHIKYVHLKVRPHSCVVPGCASSFGTQFARNQHHWTVHQGRKPFACACGARFGQRSHLNRHAKRCTALATS